MPSQYGHLLQTKTIWNAEETPESHSLMEQILHLEKLEVCLDRCMLVSMIFLFCQGIMSQFAHCTGGMMIRHTNCLNRNIYAMSANFDLISSLAIVFY